MFSVVYADVNGFDQADTSRKRQDRVKILWLSCPTITPLTHLWVLLGAVCYALLLWILPIDAIPDYVNYLNYARYSRETLEFNLSLGLPVVIFNEPLWLWMNIALHEWGQWEPETIVKFWSVAPAAVVAWLLLRHHQRKWPLIIALVLTHAFVVGLFYGALRQGVAVAIFMMGWYAWAMHRSLRGWAVMLAAPFIHVSMFYALALAVVCWLSWMSRIGNTLFLLGMSVLFLGIAYAASEIADVLQMRQGEQYGFDKQEGGSGLGWLLHCLMLAVVLMAPQEWQVRHRLALLNLLCFVIMFWFFDVPTRLMQSLLLLMLIGFIHLPGWPCWAVCSMVVAQNVGMIVLGQHRLFFGPT